MGCDLLEILSIERGKRGLFECVTAFFRTPGTVMYRSQVLDLVSSAIVVTGAVKLLHTLLASTC